MLFSYVFLILDIVSGSTVVVGTPSTILQWLAMKSAILQNGVVWETCLVWDLKRCKLFFAALLI